jgi:hypothetical protein
LLILGQKLAFLHVCRIIEVFWGFDMRLGRMSLSLYASRTANKTILLPIRCAI